MYVKVYYNYSLDTKGNRTAIKHGYKPGDKLVEVWDGFINNPSRLRIAEDLFHEINSYEELSLPKVLGMVDMGRGDVVYFPKKKLYSYELAYARTISNWKLIKNFIIPKTLVMGGGYNDSWSYE